MKLTNNALRVFSLLLLIAVAGTVTAQKPKWNKYRSERGNFKLKFPARPEISDESHEESHSYKAMAQFEEGVYYSSYTVHEKKLNDPKRLAKASYDAFLEQIKGKEVSNSTWQVGDSEGIEADLFVESNNLKIRYKVIIIGQNQYQLVVATEKDKFDEKLAKKFLDSFKLL